MGIGVLALLLTPACERKETPARQPNGATSTSAARITFGATLPLTGDAAAWGKNTQQGIELALEQINASGGVLGRKLEVIYEDTQTLAKEGVSAYRKRIQ